ncbi:cellulose synthase family protein [Galbibacter pacificus]|uniref:Glycosyltransferase family 2 protein n=1 Tax=Galbibacter pacificus TaxID=2996052 RepID=A0ABT6FWA3_9FLAO|nr:cellulose synthase family protein [Galbibacter pacificus]MDG3584014.1 glycosyltransferase family 2 protein [Galbibacter pacificus]MDG3587549.1 glycosyltransferase family 2 protein [Galbibacter pacificus]
MIEIASYIILTIYIIALLLILFYSITQLNLLLNYLKFRRQKKNMPKFDFSGAKQIPNVTIQLPIYNEAYVVERLLENISEIEYPAEKLEIQVLDDSTDESIEKTSKKIKELRHRGIDIKHITRANRIGFKAGALKEGLAIAKGDFIAIFDADFLPKADWLKKTVPYFKNQKIGVVQTKWGHINRNYSLLTKIQAFALDAHFTIEQVGRSAKNHFINFNGTAGIWRKNCIIDAGNWQSDTLTEDLDLSYRAQLKNWKFLYLEDVETPAELPVIISAARTQQFRWNKGGAENFKKNIGNVINSRNIPIKTKLHGVAHLLNSSMFLCALLVAVLSIPIWFIQQQNIVPPWVVNFTWVFIASTLILYICYWFPYKYIHAGKNMNIANYTVDFIRFFTIVLGFTLHNSMAVLEGYRGKKSEFIRTPKFNVMSIKDRWQGNKYVSKSISKNLFFEAFLMLYFLFGLIYAFILKDFSFFPFHLMVFFGFSFVFFQSIRPK